MKKPYAKKMKILAWFFISYWNFYCVLKDIDWSNHLSRTSKKLVIFSANKTAAILYLADNENYGRDSVASQYFMQLAEYVRLPVISWRADNSAFDHGMLQLQLAPTIKHQVSQTKSLRNLNFENIESWILSFWWNLMCGKPFEEICFFCHIPANSELSVFT